MISVQIDHKGKLVNALSHRNRECSVVDALQYIRDAMPAYEITPYAIAGDEGLSYRATLNDANAPLEDFIWLATDKIHVIDDQGTVQMYRHVRQGSSGSRDMWITSHQFNTIRDSGEYFIWEDRLIHCVDQSGALHLDAAQLIERSLHALGYPQLNWWQRIFLRSGFWLDSETGHYKVRHRHRTPAVVLTCSPDDPEFSVPYLGEKLNELNNKVYGNEYKLAVGYLCRAYPYTAISNHGRAPAHLGVLAARRMNVVVNDERNIAWLYVSGEFAKGFTIDDDGPEKVLVKIHELLELLQHHTTTQHENV